MTGKPSQAPWRRHWPRLLFAIPFVALLWVPSFNSLEPELGGIPFFYWYQLAWILVGAVIALVVYLLEGRIRRESANERRT
jgi:hypothetical protein